MDSRQLRFDDRPEIEYIQLRLHRDGPIVILGDHPRHHYVPYPAVKPGCSRVLHHLASIFDCPLLATLEVRWHQLQRDRVEGHTAPLRQTSTSMAANGATGGPRRVAQIAILGRAGPANPRALKTA